MRNNHPNYNLLFVAIAIVLLTFILVQNASPEEYITKQIGDDEYEFVIFDNYDDLKEAYITLIDTYVEAENKCIEDEKIINNFINLSTTLDSQYNSLEKSISDLNKDLDKYMKTTDKGKFYIGPLVGYHFLFDDNEKTSFVTIGGAISWVKPTYMISLEVPLSIYIEKTAISAGINVPLQFRLSK